MPDQKPGHPLYVSAGQGKGRWDNPSLYLVRYLSLSPVAAIGEAFGHLAAWAPEMLSVPVVPGARRRLGTYRFDETANPLLDLDDARVLADRGLRPTHVVIRDRPRTQKMAADIFAEQRWAGIQWWSCYRPQWTAVALWAAANLTVASVEDIPGHPALAEAAATLAARRRAT